MRPFWYVSVNEASLRQTPSDSACRSLMAGKGKKGKGKGKGKGKQEEKQWATWMSRWFRV